MKTVLTSLALAASLAAQAAPCDSTQGLQRNNHQEMRVYGALTLLGAAAFQSSTAGVLVAGVVLAGEELLERRAGASKGQRRFPSSVRPVADSHCPSWMDYGAPALVILGTGAVVKLSWDF